MICTLCKKTAPVGGFGTRVWKGQNVPLKRCPDCREYFTTWRKAPGSKALASEARHESKASRKKKKSQSTKEWRLQNADHIAEHDAKPEVKKRRLETQAEWTKSTPKGKAKTKKNNDRRAAKIKASASLTLKDNVRVEVTKLARKKGGMTENVKKFTEFKDVDDFWSHFKEKYEPGMTDANYGNGPSDWQIGHVIAQAYFNGDDEDDLMRCWMKVNLIPQWAEENRKAGVALPSDTVIQRMASVGCYASVIGVGVPDRVGLESRARQGVLFV